MRKRNQEVEVWGEGGGDGVSYSCLLSECLEESYMTSAGSLEAGR